MNIIWWVLRVRHFNKIRQMIRESPLSVTRVHMSFIEKHHHLFELEGLLVTD